MRKFKYIHILLHDETKFNLPLIKNINANGEIFKKEEHLFVTVGEKIYKEAKEFSNVIYDAEGKNLVNKYASRCEWIVIHGHLSVMTGIRIKNKYLRKIILRFWGGSIGYEYKEGNPFKNVIKKVLNKLYIGKLSRFGGFGIANKVDTVTIRKTLPNMPIFEMPYGLGKRKEILDAVKDEAECRDINVLVGHNAWDHDNHIEILKKLAKYGDRIKIYVPLSYGNESYSIKVEKYIDDNNTGNITIVKNFMPYDDYIKFLNKMDVAIFDGDRSYALGNIAILLLLNKKLFVNRNGVIKEAFDEDFVPYKCVDEIEHMDFEEFIKEIDYPENMVESMLPYSKERATNAWETFFKEFN